MALLRSARAAPSSSGSSAPVRSVSTLARLARAGARPPPHATSSKSAPPATASPSARPSQAPLRTATPFMLDVARGDRHLAGRDARRATSRIAAGVLRGRAVRSKATIAARPGGNRVASGRPRPACRREPAACSAERMTFELFGSTIDLRRPASLRSPRRARRSTGSSSARPRRSSSRRGSRRASVAVAGDDGDDARSRSAAHRARLRASAPRAASVCSCMFAISTRFDRADARSRRASARPGRRCGRAPSARSGRRRRAASRRAARAPPRARRCRGRRPRSRTSCSSGSATAPGGSRRRSSSSRAAARPAAARRLTVAAMPRTISSEPGAARVDDARLAQDRELLGRARDAPPRRAGRAGEQLRAGQAVAPALSPPPPVSRMTESIVPSTGWRTARYAASLAA